jgi:hypothetical protein
MNTLHLTHEQLCDLLLADLSRLDENDSDVVHEHLRACLLCSAELESLRSSLSLFRSASSSYASQVFVRSSMQRESIAPPQRYLSQPLYWAAAAIILVAASFPLSLHRQHSSAPAADSTISSVSSHAPEFESDDALLEDVDQKLSADVPSPMEPLADPTAGAYPAKSASHQRKN